MKCVLSFESFLSVDTQQTEYLNCSHSYSRIFTPLHNGLIETRVQTRGGRVSCLLVWNYDEDWKMDNKQIDKRTFLLSLRQETPAAECEHQNTAPDNPAPCRHFSVCHNLNSHEYLLQDEGNITDNKIQNIYTNISISSSPDVRKRTAAGLIVWNGLRLRVSRMTLSIFDDITTIGG